MFPGWDSVLRQAFESLVVNHAPQLLPLKISVVIPIYNAERHLKDCLRSVVVGAARLETERPGWSAEIIAVDDGSTDDTGRLLDDAAWGDGRLTVLHQANGGEGAARNAGMARATGDLIAFLDVDDVFHPQALVSFAWAWERTGADVIRYGWRAVREHRWDHRELGECSVVSVDLRRRTESTVDFCRLGSPTVISRRIAGLVKWTALRQGADMVFLLECLRLSAAVAYVDAPLLDYLTHPESVSRRLSVSLITGTCAYLPLVFAGCQALRESPASHFATCRYVSEFAFRRLPGVWRLFAGSEERQTVFQAYWRLLTDLGAQRQLFSPSVRRIIALVTARMSPLLLKYLLCVPYRLMRGLGDGVLARFWFVSGE